MIVAMRIRMDLIDGILIIISNYIFTIDTNIFGAKSRMRSIGITSCRKIDRQGICRRPVYIVSQLTTEAEILQTTGICSKICQLTAEYVHRRSDRQSLDRRLCRNS
jgi:hypothetical protein